MPAVLLLAFILFTAVEYWSVLTIYQQAQHLKYYALSTMEVNGGLTAEEEQTLIEKLEPLAKEGTVKLKGTLLPSGGEPVFWPDKVWIEIEFIPRVDNFLSRTLIGGQPGKPIKIRIGGEAISAKVSPEGGGPGRDNSTVSGAAAVYGNGVGCEGGTASNPGGRKLEAVGSHLRKGSGVAGTR